MNKLVGLAIAVLLSVSVLVGAQQRVVTVCDYEPPESHVTGLSVQGSFSWFDGPYSDDRNRVLAASMTADYGSLRSSESFARQLDARAEIRGRTPGWTGDFEGAGSLTSFFDEGLFAVGAFGIDASISERLEVDLTAGIGNGRFRDVTPLARAILIQNALLDLGELLAPVSNEVLLDLAQILGEVGSTDEERIVLLVERLLETELIRGEEMDVRGLLEIDRILEESGTSRLCGSDVQVRIGVSALLLPEPLVSSTGVVQARYALVPDPVSQVESSVEAKIRLAHFEQMNVTGSISYDRELPEGWTARAEYRLELDRMWTEMEATSWFHAVSSSLTTQILGSVGLSLVANAEYRTGDEEITFSLGMHLEADVF